MSFAAVGWQIDPFGHSLTQTTLLGTSVGFDSVMFGRSDYQDLSRRRRHRELEMVWGASDDKGHASIFAVNFASGNYGPPAGFWWEWGPSPDSIIIDNVLSPEYNVKERIDLFVERCQELANVTRGRDILVLMGSDFNYNNARYWYQSLDKLIHYSNLDGRIHAFYSSPEDYVSAKATYNIQWPRKTDDFFPYADFGHAYWTGYFTSRPNSKRYIRQATAYLQAARQVEAFAGRYTAGLSTDSLEEAISLLQHHDAITGTARQHVVNDYHRRLHVALYQTTEMLKTALSRLLGLDQLPFTNLARQRLLMIPGDHDGKTLSQLPAVQLKSCPWLNISSCEITSRWSDEGDKGLVVVYNPLSWPRTVPVRIPISGQSSCIWHVEGPSGKVMSPQIIEISNATRKLQQLSASINATDVEDHGSAELVFEAKLPPLGFSSYAVHVQGCNGQARSTSHGKESASSNYKGKDKNKHSISNGHVAVHFNHTTGLMMGLTYEDGRRLPLSIDMWWYNASDGCETSEGGGQASGAYIFRPNGCYRVGKGRVTLEIVHGELVQEARQVFDNWATMTTRLIKGQRYIEVEWTVGPIPWEDNYGREVVLRYTTGLDSGNEWFTDANGREMIRRRRNYRPSWDLNVTENISGNYYPATSAVSLKDKVNDWQFAVVLDRAQGRCSFFARFHASKSPCRILKSVMYRRCIVSHLWRTRVDVAQKAPT